MVNLDLGAVEVVNKLQARGYQAYLVGGCVRDLVLKRAIKDVDIATSALPEEVMAIFPRTVPTGLQHGTVTVILKRGTYEVTTFRKESQYEEFRRPKEVEYIQSLEEDLKRRDFTMNAMAMDSSGTLIDPFDGQKDLEAGVLRCVGLAEERFGEDALRMLRCIRFASTYGLTIEAKTWEALLQQAPLLRHIAMERVHSELTRMVEGAAPARAARLLLASRLWLHFKSQLELPFERWLAHPGALDAVSALAEQHTRWVLLLLLLETPSDGVRTALQELKFSRAQTDAVVTVLSLHEWLSEHLTPAAERAGEVDPPAASCAEGLIDPSVAGRIWKLGAVRHGTPAAKAWLQVMRVVPAPEALVRLPQGGPDKGLADPAERIGRSWPSLLLERGEAWLHEMPCASLKELAVTGGDLATALERAAGPWLGRLLQELLEKAAVGELANEREALLQAVTQIVK
jgi:tRNA nucleotidyltransferase (CCA-adding enzyme)